MDAAARIEAALRGVMHLRREGAGLVQRGAGVVVAGDHPERQPVRAGRTGDGARVALIGRTKEALDGAARGGALARGRGGHDPDAARGALAFMRSLATRRVKGKRGRGWSRDDLYEDRIGRWAKS